MLTAGNRSKESNPACLNSVCAWVAFLLRLPVVGSCCGRAGAVDAGNPSTSGDGGAACQGGRFGGTHHRWAGRAKDIEALTGSTPLVFRL
jgi:hypothetical protein